MSTKTDEPILNTPISDLNISEEFKNKAGRLGFQTLAELVKCEPDDLAKLPGFGYRMVTEMISFLEERGLGQYVRP